MPALTMNYCEIWSNLAAMDRLTGMQVAMAIADKGSLTAAAEALELSLPSVVRTLAALERHLGVRLFNRTTRRVSATDEGRLFVERCRSALAAVEEAESVVSSRREKPSGRITVTASELFGRRFVAPAAREFLRAHPAVTIELLLVDRMVNLVEEGIDVAVRIGELADSSLIALPVGEVRRVVCASPECLRRHGTPRHPSELRDYPCVSFGSVTPGPVWPFRDGSRKLSVPVQPRLACNQVDAAIDSCVEGVGAGMFLSYQVASLRHAKALRYILEPFEDEPRPIHIVYPHARLRSAAVRLFAEACGRAVKAARLA
jgi:DNA-binding transcriptional LysR family regulator